MAWGMEDWASGCTYKCRLESLISVQTFITQSCVDLKGMFDPVRAIRGYVGTRTLVSLSSTGRVRLGVLLDQSVNANVSRSRRTACRAKTPRRWRPLAPNRQQQIIRGAQQDLINNHMARYLIMFIFCSMPRSRACWLHRDSRATSPKSIHTKYVDLVVFSRNDRLLRSVTRCSTQ